MKYLLDTCVISDFVKGDSGVMKRLRSERPVDLAISAITVMEFQYGLALHPDRAKQLEPIIHSLIRMIEVIPYENAEAIATAKIRASLKHQDMPIDPYDVLIAGTAMSRQLTMVTSNTDEFEKVGSLLVEDWRLNPKIVLWQ
jgi:tRNA(fMet)-specific endonuclease VapC